MKKQNENSRIRFEEEHEADQILDAQIAELEQKQHANANYVDLVKPQ